MTANLSHFAIECDDVERAKAFYEAVFGWRIEPWGPPGFYQVFTGAKARPGVQGALQGRREPLTGTGNRGFECTIGVDSLRDAVAAATAGGGRIDMPEYRIEGVGNLVYILDTEGNRVGIMQYDAGLAWGEGAAPGGG